MVWKVDACDASHLVEIKDGVHVLDVEALIIVDDVRIQLLGVPLLCLVCGLKVIAFANIDNLGVVGIHSLCLDKVSDEERAVIGAEGKVLVVLAVLATGQHLACFSVQRHPEGMLDGKGRDGEHLDVTIAEADKSDLLLAQRASS